MASPDRDLREKLLDAHLDILSSQALSAWLRDIGQNPKGSVGEKVARVRQHTKYLETPVEEFPARTIRYLLDYKPDDLAHICESLGLDPDGSRVALVRRIYREIGFREGWLERISPAKPRTSLQTVLSFVDWYPVLRSSTYERDYYNEFREDMIEVFGEENVHEQLPVAHGSLLKIDFHIGHPQQGGVGVEFKMPTNNSECQKALGQMDQYVERYGSDLIVLLFLDFLQSAQRTFLRDGLARKNITIVIKQKID